VENWAGSSVQNSLLRVTEHMRNRESIKRAWEIV